MICNFWFHYAVTGRHRYVSVIVVLDAHKLSPTMKQPIWMLLMMFSITQICFEVGGSHTDMSTFARPARLLCLLSVILFLRGGRPRGCLCQKSGGTTTDNIQVDLGGACSDSTGWLPSQSCWAVHLSWRKTFHSWLAETLRLSTLES